MPASRPVTVPRSSRRARPAGEACGCSVRHQPEPDRRAVAVDPEIKTANLNRLRRIEGQVRGLQRMVTEERYCADILAQIASVQEALRAVGKGLLRNHLRHCVRDAVVTRPEDAEAMYDELVQLFDRHGS